MKDNIQKNPVPSFEKRRVLRQSVSPEAVCMDDFLHLFSFLGFDDPSEEDSALLGIDSQGSHSIEIWFDMEGYLSAIGKTAGDISSLVLELDASSSGIVPFYVYTTSSRYVACESDMQEDSLFIDILDIYSQTGAVDLLITPIDDDSVVTLSREDFYLQGQTFLDEGAESLVVTIPPTKTCYLPGESFLPQGMEVCLHHPSLGLFRTKDYLISNDAPLSIQDTSVTLVSGQLQTGVPISVCDLSQDSPSPSLGCFPDVRLTDGEVFFSLHDISMGENSYRVDVFHSYREDMPSSVQAMSTPCGRGFMLSLDMFIRKESTDRYFFVDENGYVHSFRRFDEGRYHDTLNAFTLLCENADGASVTFEDGRILGFDQAGRLCSIRSSVSDDIVMKIDRNPNDGRIGLVYDERKYDGHIREECLVFSYDRNGMLSDISIFENARGGHTRVFFSYDSEGRLVGRSVRRRTEEGYATFDSTLLQYGQDGILREIRDLPSGKTFALSTQEENKIISSGYTDQTFVQKERLVIHHAQDNTATVESLDGPSLLYQWDELGRSMETLLVREDGLYTRRSLKGEEVSLTMSPGTERFNGEGLFWSPSLGFSFTYDFALGPFQNFTLSFYVMTIQEDTGNLFIEAYYPENGHTATTVFTHTERTFTQIRSHARGRWQRVDIPIRFDTGLQREGTPEVTLVLRDTNLTTYPFMYTAPRVVPADIEDISIRKNGTVLFDSTKLYGEGVSVTLSRNGNASPVTFLSVSDVALTILRRSRTGTTFDIILEDGRSRMAGVTSVSCNGEELFSSDVSVVLERKSGKVSEGVIDRKMFTRTADGHIQETASHIILDRNGNVNDETIVSVTERDIHGRIVSERTGNALVSYTYTSTGNLSDVHLSCGDISHILYQATYDRHDEYLLEESRNGVSTSFTYRDSLLCEKDEGRFQRRDTYNMHGDTTSMSFRLGDTLLATHLASYTDREISSLSDGLMQHSFFHDWQTDAFSESTGGTLRLDTVQTPSSLVRTYHRSQAETDIIEDAFDPISGYLMSRKVNGITVATYTYEDTNHIDSWKVSQIHDELSGRDTSIFYDVYGNMTTMTEGCFHTTISEESRDYFFTDGPALILVKKEDAFGRPQRVDCLYAGESSEEGRAVFLFTYDSLGRVQERESIEQEDTLTYSYGENLLPCRTTHTLFTQLNEEITYDSRNKITSLSQNSSTQLFVYDGAGRLTEERRMNPQGNILKRRQYSYSGERISSLTSDGTSFTFSYDSEGRLSSLSSGGNTLLSLSYDSFGNLTRKGISQDMGIEYSYERGSLLSRVSLTSDTSNPFMGTFLGVHTFSYDHRGRRTRKDNIEYFYDGDTLLAEKRGIDHIFYFYDGQGIAGFIYNQDIYEYVRNVLGDVVAIVRDGGLIGTYEYDAYGNILSMTNNHIMRANPIRYRGYYYDSETGLYYLRNRYYDPLLMRFLTADDSSYLKPETLSGLDPYVYCRYDPVMYKDPDGQFAISTSVIVGAIVGAIIGAGTAIAITAAVDYNDNEQFDKPWYEYLLFGTVGGVVGAIIGGLIGYGVGYALGGTYSNGLVAKEVGKGIKSVLLDLKKVDHITNAKHNLLGYSKHALHKLMKTTFAHGTVGPYKKAALSVFLRSKGVKITFVIKEGSVLISDMWII